MRLRSLSGMDAVPAATVQDLPSVGRVLAHSASGRILGGAFAAAVACRARRGRLRPTDGIVVAAVAAAHPFVEWAVHRFVLHAPVRTLAGKRLDLSPGHRAHHAAPDDLATATLPARAAVLDACLLAGLAAAVVSVTRPSQRRTLAPTAAGAALASLLTYEWVHLLLHAGRKPRSAWLRRQRALHRLHHHRSERSWFGVTSPVADRLFGTLPPDPSAVPRSPTVRAINGGSAA
jgi:hypothetical protein